MAANPESVQLEVRDGIAVITIDNPPVNALSRHVRQGICDTVREAVDDPGVAAIVLACAGRTFIAGADITEFGKPIEPPRFLEMIDVLDDAPKPVVAAIHGTAPPGEEISVRGSPRVRSKTAATRSGSSTTTATQASGGAVTTGDDVRSASTPALCVGMGPYLPRVSPRITRCCFQFECELESFAFNPRHRAIDRIRDAT